ncbi:hypothetical protein BDN67DRAFT_996503 [Paxillus ammoniavirescens]|nr:hypothetical protein BDN67DRAFT_996503 [Paxillus ammoniavirescens]
MAPPLSFRVPERSFLSCLFALLLSMSLSSHVFVNAQTPPPPLNVTFPAQPDASSLVNVVQDNFLGVSFELSSFDTLWGETPTAMPNAMKNYMSNLRQRHPSPLRIRIGGNSMDGSTWVPTQTQMIVLTDPNAYYNDVPVNFGPTLFDVLNSMADTVGEMAFIIGLSMRDPDDDTNVIELAAAADQMLGDRLDSMLLGNEPDLYAGNERPQNYSIADYIPEIDKVLDDLENYPEGNLIPKTIIGGPTICCAWDLDDVLSGGLLYYPYKYYTLQHYPTYICNGPTPSNTNISYFLSHTNVPAYAQWQSTGIEMAKNVSVPVLMTEYNSVSCGGSNVSDTFAATLWAVDAALNFASAGLSGAYLHTREYQVLYNLFDPPTPSTSTESGWHTGSPYYSALFLSETFIPGGSIVVDINLNNSIYDPASTVAGYAIYNANGTSCERLVLINYGLTGQLRNFTLPQNVAPSIGFRLLVAPSVEEKTDISWAGQTVGQNGDLEGTQTTEWVECGDGCAVGVPGPGAALILFGDYANATGFFVGNSTIAGLNGGWCECGGRFSVGLCQWTSDKRSHHKFDETANECFKPVSMIDQT